MYLSPQNLVTPDAHIATMILYHWQIGQCQQQKRFPPGAFTGRSLIDVALPAEDANATSGPIPVRYGGTMVLESRTLAVQIEREDSDGNGGISMLASLSDHNPSLPMCGPGLLFFYIMT